ncbi:MAG: prolyl aminopeptidase [Pseudomonadota bacterium]
MLNLFPDIHPYSQQTIEVEAPHKIYVEESGSPDGIPVLFVHGGPGAGTESWNRCFFDPQVYRIILFDQRGCGRSKPHCCLENNSTDKLVEDMETIRKQLDIDKWVLFGGSWGSTLSLVYAQAHPEHVLTLILRGIFLCRAEEINWFYQHGAKQIFPDYWQEFIKPLNKQQQKDILHSYHQLLHDRNEVKQLSAARSWSLWEAACSTLQPSKSLRSHFSNAHTALSLAKIESHYFIHNSFLEENQILKHMDKLKGISGIIVQGRYDLVCPMANAWELHQNWPGSRLEIVVSAGHSAKEASITDALIRATIETAKEIKKLL